MMKVLPGFALSVAVALLACWLESLLPVHVIGSAVIAMFIGMAINCVKAPAGTLAPGLKFTSKKVLKLAIVLLGLSLNVTTIVQVGRMSLTVMIFTLMTCFGSGYFIGLNTSFASMKKAGVRPMLHGFIISALVVVVALLVEMGMGIV